MAALARSGSEVGKTVRWTVATKPSYSGPSMALVSKSCWTKPSASTTVPTGTFSKQPATPTLMMRSG